ncbi:hypothetical protein SAMN05421821_11638 [Mucilaginibacter lappiensis]|uniref:Uncharacterized protein n=2 Tax=Mucilaginibacter lappiensis TaxID=354630 RepID=A0ABR6PQT4_9SPHI|nr:hypothetical protein [Mucilaginibacter lappiensis]MBB6112142.1 hypothetical protein [Mucilaginibacter lappiensis]SIR93826.1 hypothetical protein SAMN05421821_11638 [Mucilaginibacter lappiensis]
MSSAEKYRQSRLLVGIISLFSMSLLTRAPFENNPQDCGMISVAGKKHKGKQPTDEDHMHL